MAIEKERAPRYFIKTYGCQMNVNDSEMMAGLLENAGYVRAYSPEDSDVTLINTCCVRQKAEDKAVGYALGLVAPKMRKPGRIIALCGCVAEKDKEALFKKIPFIDLVVGPGQEARIVQLIDEIKGGREKIAALGANCGKYPSASALRAKTPQAYVTIMFGCDNYCSFCVVPYVRGREVSRPKEEILEEVKGLDKKIFKEVVLLGQNVNSYRDKGQGVRVKGYGLGELLIEVHEIKGIERIRFLTSHPRDMSDDIIDAVRDLPKVCEYFHLPLQSGDDQILKAMNRGYTSDQFRQLVERIRAKVPEASITSDAIAGFPGETEQQFQNTLDLIRELELDLVNTFVYSKRPGTAAEKLDGQLPENVKSERLRRLMGVVEETALKCNQKLVGSDQEVLVEKTSEKGFSGRTRGNKIVSSGSKGPKTGDIVRVSVKKAGAWVLEA